MPGIFELSKLIISDANIIEVVALNNVVRCLAGESSHAHVVLLLSLLVDMLPI